MKDTFLKAIRILALGLTVGLTLTQISLQAQSREQGDGPNAAAVETGRGARAIEGTWNVVVTLRNCTTGAPLATFKAMDLFIQGGSMVDTNAAPPSTRGPGFGSWQYAGEHQFTAVLRFFLYNTDGTFAGTRRIAQDITIADDNNSWESTVGTIVFDPAGNPVATGCGTAVAARAE
jgi:hypothetical protein